MTAADAQPTLPGFGSTSGIASQSHLLPPLSALDPKSLANPGAYSAKALAAMRSVPTSSAGFFEWLRALPQQDRSRLILECTADDLAAEERRDARRAKAAAPMIRSLKARYPGFVYFVRTAEEPKSHVKIGYSLDPDTRVKTLRVAQPAELYVEAVMPGDIAVEHRLHQHFIEGQVQGEWFRHDTPGLSALIADAAMFEGMPWDFESRYVKDLLSWLDPPFGKGRAPREHMPFSERAAA